MAFCLGTAPGFDHTVLSVFRTRLLRHGAERRLFDAVLTYADNHDYVKAGERQRSGSTHVLGAMHVLSRMEVTGGTLRHALNVLATLAPDWLRAHVPQAWVERYAERPSEYRVSKGEAKRIAWAEQTGADGMALHLMIAAAVNVVRIPRWLAGEPKATTPVPAFARLYQPVTYQSGHSLLKARRSYGDCKCPLDHCLFRD